ncbi:hypothetical protein IPG37_04475 [bacterium]|nr:MAG: hypothetical protein IPG37_04475 [bacterium]QQR63173.1 MAG: hypothetical protein IPH67_01730 [bacterium]
MNSKKLFFSCILITNFAHDAFAEPWLSKLYTFVETVKECAKYIINGGPCVTDGKTTAYFEVFSDDKSSICVPREIVIHMDLDELQNNLQKSLKNSNSNLWKTLQEYKTIDELVGTIQKKENQLKDELCNEIETFLIANYDEETATEFKNEYEKQKNLTYKTIDSKAVVHDQNKRAPYILKLMDLCGIDHRYVSIRFWPMFEFFFDAYVNRDDTSYIYKMVLPYFDLTFKNISLFPSIILPLFAHILLKHHETYYLMNFIEYKIRKQNTKFEWPAEITKKLYSLMRTEKLHAHIYMFKKLQYTCTKKELIDFAKISLYASTFMTQYICKDYAPVWEEDDDSTEFFIMPYIQFAYAMRIYELLNQK